MKRRKKLLIVLAALPLVILQFTPVLIALAWLHMAGTLAAAKREGVYPTPEEAMRDRVTESWVDIEKVEIEQAGPNYPDGRCPHVWFVTARVWATRRASGKPISWRGYDLAGSYFLRVREGWVHVPEGRFPDLVGFWMRFFRYSG